MTVDASPSNMDIAVLLIFFGFSFVCLSTARQIATDQALAHIDVEEYREILFRSNTRVLVPGLSTREFSCSVWIPFFI